MLMPNYKVSYKGKTYLFIGYLPEGKARLCSPCGMRTLEVLRTSIQAC